MKTFLRENLLFLIGFLLFLVGSLSAVTYLNSSKVFDAKVQYVNSDKFPYYVIVEINKKAKSSIDLNFEVLLDKDSIVVSSKKYLCNADICEVKLELDKVFFDKHKIVIRTKYKNKFFEKILNFDLKNNNKEFDLGFDKNYYFNQNSKLNIFGKLSVFNNKKSNKFQLEIFPKDFPENKETLNLDCSLNCNIDFSLKNNIVFGEYIVRAYSATSTVETSFNILLDSNLVSSKFNLNEISNNLSNLNNLNVSNLTREKVFNLDKNYNKDFSESTDKISEKKTINLAGFSNFDSVIIEYEDILGNKFEKNISFFTGSFEVESGAINARIKSLNSTNNNDINLKITPQISSFSDIENLNSNINSKKSFSIISGKKIISDSVYFNGRKFNSSKDFYNLIKNSKEIVPGFGKYTLTLSDGTTTNVYFAYGLISINTKKPLYLPSQNVELYMVVLDKKGYLYSRANITLDIKNGLITNTYNLEIKETVKSGVYNLNFQNWGIGKYDLTARVNIEGIDVDINSYFNVVDS